VRGEAQSLIYLLLMKMPGLVGGEGQETKELTELILTPVLDCNCTNNSSRGHGGIPGKIHVKI